MPKKEVERDVAGLAARAAHPQVERLHLRLRICCTWPRLPDGENVLANLRMHPCQIQYRPAQMWQKIGFKGSAKNQFELEDCTQTQFPNSIFI